MATGTNLGQLYITLGANTDALNSLPPVLKSLEATLSKLESTVNRLNDSMSKSYQAVANSAAKSAEAVKKAEEAKVSNMEKLHGQALEMNKRLDAAKQKSDEESIRSMGLAHSKALEMDAAFNASRVAAAQAAGEALIKKQQQIDKLWESRNKPSAKQPSMDDIWGAREKELVNQKVADSERGFKAIEALRKEDSSASKAANNAAKAEIKEYESLLDDQIKKEQAVSRALALKVQKMKDSKAQMDKLHGQALEMNKNLDAANKKSADNYNRQMVIAHTKALEMDAKFNAKRLQEAKSTGTNWAKIFTLGLVDVGAKADGASNHLSATTSKARNLGLGVQNTSYQLQDMIVQLEMGTDVSRVLGQQLPQLLSGFGALGAVAGLVAAGLAVAIPAIFSSGDSAEEAAAKVDKYTEAMDLAASITNKLEESQAKLNGTVSELELGVIRHELNRLSEELFDGSLWSTLFAESIGKDFAAMAKTLIKARKELEETQRNNIKTDILQTSTILNQTAAYNKGLISLREYEVQKKLIEEINDKEIQGNKEAIRLLEEQIRLQYNLADEEGFIKIQREVADMNLALYQANALFKDTLDFGTNAGEATKQQFERADLIKQYARSLQEAGSIQTEYWAMQLKISVAGLSESDAVAKVSKALADRAMQTKIVTTATANLLEIQKNAASLSDRIAGFQAGKSVFDQTFSQDALKRASDLEKRTREIERNLEFKMVGDKDILVNTIDEYRKIATEAGMVDPFKGARTAREVAVGIATLEQNIQILEESLTKINTWDSSAIVEMDSKLNDINLQLEVMSKMTFGDKILNMFDTAPLERMIQKEKEIQKLSPSLEQLFAYDPRGYAIRVEDVATSLERLNITGQDLSSPRGVAAAMVEIDKKMKELPTSAKAVLGAVSALAGQAGSLFGQLSSMYAEQASYHKQMADQALQYGRDQASLYMELADAVHYSNNVQAQSFEQKAIAAAEAAAKQYQAEKKAQAQSNALAKQQFENQKKLQIAQAVASTAAAVVGTLGNQAGLLGPFAVPIAMAMGALGAAQVGIIQQQQYTPRATGGSALSNRTHIVGESGPEIFVPGRAGTVLSQKTIAESLMNGGSGGEPVVVNFNINAIDTQSATQVILQNRAAIENIVYNAKNRRMER